MTAFNHAAFFAELRKEMGPLKQPQVDMFNRAVIAALGPPDASGPPWLAAGMTKIGEREVKGPTHNPWIVNTWARLGAGWFKDDETPWCGLFIGWCIAEAGLPVPKGGTFARAGAWATWGVPCLPQLGAIGVKGRVGGNHVFMLAGITEDGKHFLALGGNQNDGVSIAPIPVHEVYAVRWPSGVTQLHRDLPIMAKTTTAAREA